MASRALQESNRYNSSEFTGECSVRQSCEPCLKTNVLKTATVFCESCDEYLCDACKNPHTVYKPGNHNIVNFSDKKSAPVIIDMKGMDKCHEHERQIEFICKDHSKLCCSSCVLVHRKCDQVDEIAKVSVHKAPEIQALKQSLIKLQTEADAIIAGSKLSETSLNESIAKISSEVDTMRDRIIQLFEEAKQKLISEAKDFKTAEMRRISNTRDTSFKVKEDINTVLSICSVILERGTPCQQYIYSELMKEKQKTLKSNIYDQRKITFATVTVSFLKELTLLLEMGSNFIKLNVDGNTTGKKSPISLSSQPRPVTLELLVSVDLPKTGDDENEPWLTGLDFLPDGRLVAVDNKNRKCIVMNERLKRVGPPYKFKCYPCSVVCVSHDALCVTFSSKVVCLLSVSTNNTIRLTREMITSSKFDSICCMSPSHMVVSTFDDTRHARIISVDNVEKDFDNVMFPTKTYGQGESVCTYVKSRNMLVLTDRFAHTVYMYDTVNGTSRTVTNENIQEPRGACVGPGDTVLVCSRRMNSIIHLSADAEILGTYPVDMWYPHSISVSRDSTRLALSGGVKGAMKLHLYKISPVMS